MSEHDRVPQHSSLANLTAASRKASGSPCVPGRATSCNTPHQFSVFVCACITNASASESTPLPGPLLGAAACKSCHLILSNINQPDVVLSSSPNISHYTGFIAQR